MRWSPGDSTEARENHTEQLDCMHHCSPTFFRSRYIHNHSESALFIYNPCTPYRCPLPSISWTSSDGINKRYFEITFCCKCKWQSWTELAQMAIHKINKVKKLNLYKQSPPVWPLIGTQRCWLHTGGPQVQRQLVSHHMILVHVRWGIHWGCPDWTFQSSKKEKKTKTKVSYTGVKTKTHLVLSVFQYTC